MKRLRGFLKRRTGRQIFIAVAVLSPLLIVLSRFSTKWRYEKLYAEGKAILNEHGSGAARAFFEEQTDQTGSALLLFGYGWTCFLEGDVGEAEKIALFLMIEDVDQEVRVHATYLYGCTTLLCGDDQRALQLFGQAFFYYERYGTKEQAYHALLGMAQSYAGRGSFTAADETLSQAEEIAEANGLDKARLFSLRIWLAELTGDFDAAYQWSLAYADALPVRAQREQLFSVLNHLAYFGVLAGCFEEAGRYLAQATVLAAGDVRDADLAFHHLCQILYKRCAGIPVPGGLEEDVTVWIEANHDLELHAKLDLVTRWGCS